MLCQYKLTTTFTLLGALSLKLGSYQGLELSFDADTAYKVITSITAFVGLTLKNKQEKLMEKVKYVGASFLRV